MESAWELDGYAVQIGLRTLGGNPEAFYLLSRERQIDVLAVLLIEREPPPKMVKAPRFKIEGSDEAKAFWGGTLTPTEDPADAG